MLRDRVAEISHDRASDVKSPGALAGATGAAGIQQASGTRVSNSGSAIAATKSLTRGEAITANCRDCIHDDRALGTWRQQTSACHLTACPFWRHRPLAGGVPDFIASRDPARLPTDWRSLSHDAAMAIIAGKGDGKRHGWAVEAIGGASKAREAPVCPAGL
jgi:hypothetical protein